MSIPKPEIEIHRVTLTPEQAARYEEITDIVSDIMNEDDGLMFLLNALVQQGDTVLSTMALWTRECMASTLDARDIAGFVHERPLSLPDFV